ncbi:MAG: endonuclease/exonuclease/phosphatase family protein [Akkermansia sp.]
MRRRPSKRGALRRVDVFLVTLLVIVLSLMKAYFEPEEVSFQQKSQDSQYVRTMGTPLADKLRAQQLPPKDAASLRFMMYNVKNYFVAGEPQRTRYRLYLKSEKSRDAVADVIAHAQPEVLGLIEMGGKLALEDLRQRLQKRGLDYPYFRILERHGDDRALALLSQHPIVRDHSRAHYGLYGNQKRRLLRGILDLEVQLDDGRVFCIVGAHLKSRVSDEPAEARSLRAKEAQTIAMYLHERMKDNPSLPILVFGDWNDGPADASLGVLSQGVRAASALTRVEAQDDSGAEWTLYYREGKEYLIFDQIYLNEVLKNRVKSKLASGVIDLPATKTASDHRPVWCEIR